MRFIFICLFIYVAYCAEIKYITSIGDFQKSFQPVKGLYVKPSEDGTTGDLYIAASEDNGVKTPWVAEKPITFFQPAKLRDQNGKANMRTQDNVQEISLDDQHKINEDKFIKYEFGDNGPVYTPVQNENVTNVSVLIANQNLVEKAPQEQFTVVTASQDVSQPLAQYPVSSSTPIDQSQPHAQYAVMPATPEEPQTQYAIISTQQESSQVPTQSQYTIIQVAQDNNEPPKQYALVPISQNPQYTVVNQENVNMNTQPQTITNQPSVVYAQLMRGPQGEVKWAPYKPLTSNMVTGNPYQRSWTPMPYYAKYVLTNPWMGTQNSGLVQANPQSITTPVMQTSSAWQQYPSTWTQPSGSWNQERSLWMQKQPEMATANTQVIAVHELLNTS